MRTEDALARQDLHLAAGREQQIGAEIPSWPTSASVVPHVTMTSRFVQRTNQAAVRAAGWFTVGSLGLVTLNCGIFLGLGVAVPEWSTVVGRWLPALVALVVLRVLALPGSLSAWWARRPGGMRRLLAGAITRIGVMALQSTIPWTIAATSTVGLFPLDLLLSALLHRFHSVWPAVLGPEHFGTARRRPVRHHRTIDGPLIRARRHVAPLTLRGTADCAESGMLGPGHDPLTPSCEAEKEGTRW